MRSVVVVGVACILAASVSGCRTPLYPGGLGGVRPETFDAPRRSGVPVPADAPQTDEEKQAAAARRVEEGDAAWKDRADPAAQERALTLYDEAALLVPSVAVFVKLARAHHLAGETALVRGGAEAALASFDRGVVAAERALGLSSPEFVKAVRAGTAFDDAVQRVDPAAAPELYWFAANLGRWARGKGLYASFLVRDRVKAAMRQVLALDPDYAGAAAHRYFGAYYALSPLFAGRDLGRAESHFREALSRSPSSLANRVTMADTLAVKRGDRALFERLLKDVLATDTTLDPETAPEQELEKLKAERMLARVSRLF
ncbi:MAG: hypothetical protein HY904_14990 [Deltaproteobacteria bacterium]|nr:hypothetical protein [Deltaproteobacteria bacterium]